MAISSPRPKKNLKGTTLLYSFAAFASVGLFAQSSNAQTAPAPVPAPTATAPAKPSPTAAAQPTNAQTPAQNPTPAANGTTAGETVVVTGARSQNRIDRQAYDLKDDPVAQNGSAADALNKVPSVNVDAEGNVSLRGNTNVQILINGRATAQTRGDNRAATILSMQGADIESVEVMNNPGAAFSSEGSGGVINLVMRRNRRPGKFLTIIANAGPKDRQNLNISGSYNKDKLNITGSFGIRNDGRNFKSSTDTVRKLAAAGATARTTQSGATEGRREGYNANFSLDYNLTDKDTIGFAANYGDRTQFGDTGFHYKGFDSANNLLREYDFKSLSDNPREDFGLGLNFEHKFANPGETLKSDLKYSNSKGLGATINDYDYTIPSVTSTQENRTRWSDDTNWVYSIDYNRPSDTAVITTGMQISIDDNQSRNTGISINGAGVITAIPNQNRAFESYQKVNAGYFTYQRGFGEKWTAQTGLRVETTDVNIKDPVSGFGSSSLYTNVNPSAFASYILNTESKIRLSYSRRIQRPNASDLNPIIVVNSAESISVGNPDLKPQTTDSMELGYEYSKQRLNYQVRAYYRINEDIITSFTRILTGNIIENSRINGGNSQTAGIEANYQNRLWDKLTIMLNSNLYYVEQDSLVPGRNSISGTGISGRAHFDYAITSKDRVQFMIGSQGKQILPQGYRTPMAMSMISYNHQFTPFASFVASMTDPFGLGKFKSVTDSESIYSISRQTIEPRGYYIGFRITLGTRPANARNQDGGMRFGPGGPGGGGGFRPPGM